LKAEKDGAAQVQIFGHTFVGDIFYSDLFFLSFFFIIQSFQRNKENFVLNKLESLFYLDP
jgi:hypothetical protein